MWISSTNSKDFHVEFSKKHIDQAYPWRHVLRLGDNKEVSQQLREFDNKKYDLVVVDVREGKKAEAAEDILRSLVHMRPGAYVVCLGLQLNDPGTGLLAALINSKALNTKKAVQWKDANDSFIMIGT